MLHTYFQNRSTLIGTVGIPSFQSGLDEEYFLLLAETQELIGRLDGICRFVPNVDFYVKLSLIQEVCASCELENVSARFYDFVGDDTNSNCTQLSSNLLSAIKHAQESTFSENLIRIVNGILTTANVSEGEYRKHDGIARDDIFFLAALNPYLPVG